MCLGIYQSEVKLPADISYYSLIQQYAAFSNRDAGTHSKRFMEIMENL